MNKKKGKDEILNDYVPESYLHILTEDEWNKLAKEADEDLEKQKAQEELRKTQQDQDDKELEILVNKIPNWTKLPKVSPIDKTKLLKTLKVYPEELNALTILVDVIVCDIDLEKENLFIQFLNTNSHYLDYIYGYKRYDVSFENKFIDHILEILTSENRIYTEHRRMGIFKKKDFFSPYHKLLQELKVNEIDKNSFLEQLDILHKEIEPRDKTEIIKEIETFTGYQFAITNKLVNLDTIVEFLQTFPEREKSVKVLLEWINEKDITRKDERFINFFLSFEHDENSFESFNYLFGLVGLDYLINNEVTEKDVFARRILNFLSILFSDEYGYGTEESYKLVQTAFKKLIDLGIINTKSFDKAVIDIPISHLYSPY